MDMLSYYGKHGIVPVHQRMPSEDFSKFRFQREALYSNLGIQMTMLSGKSIIEFGPGTGDNARVVASFLPSKIHLVDGNRASESSVNAYIEANILPSSIVKFYFSDARNFSVPMGETGDDEISNGYDLVICEGVINGNDEPGLFLQRVAKFCKPGGLLAITTVSAWGVLDQALRRIYRPAITTKYSKYEDQVNCAASIFKSHLANLPTTKPAEDWVQDAILHPLTEKYVFSAVQAIDALGPEFVAIGSSPRFFNDFRWHKSLNLDANLGNTMFCGQFRFLEPMFLDDRIQDPFAVSTLLQEIRMKEAGLLVSEIWKLSCEIWNDNSYDRINLFEDKLAELSTVIHGLFPEIDEALREFTEALPRIVSGNFESSMPYFEKWWGRGLVYLSARRN